MQFGEWITGAILSAGLLAGSPSFVQDSDGAHGGPALA